MRDAERQDDVQRVKDAADIAAVIGRHLTLKPRGREYVCLCPFHDDHKPSMNVIPHKQIFHCFACGAGGDVFSFVQKYHGMDFREALEFLGGEFGVDLSREGGRARGRPGGGGTRDGDGPEVGRGDLLRANEAANKYFRAALRHESHGTLAREMIERRGISAEMVERFELGAAPERWDGLIVSLSPKGIAPEALAGAGLTKPRQDGSAYDTFRNRLMFPIHDQIGRVIAFGGRRLSEDDPAKYLNSPESPLFSKSATLYGVHQAARAIQKRRQAVVVEGYTDVVACHQGGFENVVGTLGTALTARHAGALKRLCDEIVLLFDSDDAGRAAAERAVEVFFAEPVDVRIATLEGAKDPDELLKTEGGAARLTEAIEGAQDALEFLFDALKGELEGKGVSAQARLTEAFLSRLVELGLNTGLSPVRRRLVIRRLAEVTDTDWRTIVALTPGGRGSGATGERAGERAAGVDSERERPMGEREHLLGCVLAEPGLLLSAGPEHRGLIDPEQFMDEESRTIAALAVELMGRGDPPSLQRVLDLLEDEGAKSAAVWMTRRVEMETEGRRMGDHWSETIRRMEARRMAEAPRDDLESRLARARRKQAEFGGDPSAFPGLARSGVRLPTGARPGGPDA